MGVARYLLQSPGEQACPLGRYRPHMSFAPFPSPHRLAARALPSAESYSPSARSRLAQVLFAALPELTFYIMWRVPWPQPAELDQLISNWVRLRTHDAASHRYRSGRWRVPQRLALCPCHLGMFVLRSPGVLVS